MKILVFDDTHKHRQSALISLKGHDLTIVGTYDEAQKALTPQMDYKEAKRLFAERYSGSPDDGELQGISEEARKERRAFDEECDESATTYPDFEVVMTDLLVPASQQALGGEGEQHGGKEMPLGAIIALLALSNGIKYVAVVTDMNHHHHPASAAFDCFRKSRAEDVSIVCTNQPTWVPMDEATGKAVDRDFLKSDAGKERYPYPEGQDYGPRKGLISGKNWGEILQRLLPESYKDQKSIEIIPNTYPQAIGYRLGIFFLYATKIPGGQNPVNCALNILDCPIKLGNDIAGIPP